MQVATACYSLVNLQLPIHGLPMDRKLGTIPALFNIVPEVLSGKKKKTSKLCIFFKEWFTKTIRNIASSKRTHVTLADTPNNRTKHCLIKLRTPKHTASDMQSMLQNT